MREIGTPAGCLEEDQSLHAVGQRAQVLWGPELLPPAHYCPRCRGSQQSTGGPMSSWSSLRRNYRKKVRLEEGFRVMTTHHQAEMTRTDASPDTVREAAGNVCSLCVKICLLLPAQFIHSDSRCLSIE